MKTNRKRKRKRPVDKFNRLSVHRTHLAEYIVTFYFDCFLTSTWSIVEYSFVHREFNSCLYFSSVAYLVCVHAGCTLLCCSVSRISNANPKEDDDDDDGKSNMVLKATCDRFVAWNVGKHWIIYLIKTSWYCEQMNTLESVSSTNVLHANCFNTFAFLCEQHCNEMCNVTRCSISMANSFETLQIHLFICHDDILIWFYFRFALDSASQSKCSCVIGGLNCIRSDGKYRYLPICGLPHSNNNTHSHTHSMQILSLISIWYDLFHWLNFRFNWHL